MSPKISHPSLDDPNAWVPYRYYPSKVAAIIFVVAFSITTLLHIFQLFKKRTWYFIPLIIGGIFELTGFIGRIISHNDPWALGPFIIQSILILVAPALFAASIYIILGRIILLVNGEQYSLIRQKWLTKLFVAGDIFSFMLQSAGGGIQAIGTLSSLHTGEKVVVAGLFTQLAFFACFVVVAGIFHYRLVHDKPVKKCDQKTPAPVFAHLPWKRHLYNLYIASGLIIVRSVFRIAEYIQGNAGYLLSHEVFLYVFDAVLMLVVMVLFNCVHPSEVTEAYMKRQTYGSGAGVQMDGGDVERQAEEGRRNEK